MCHTELQAHCLNFLKIQASQSQRFPSKQLYVLDSGCLKYFKRLSLTVEPIFINFLLWTFGAGLKQQIHDAVGLSTKDRIK